MQNLRQPLKLDKGIVRFEEKSFVIQGERRIHIRRALKREK